MCFCQMNPTIYVITSSALYDQHCSTRSSGVFLREHTSTLADPGYGIIFSANPLITTESRLRSHLWWSDRVHAQVFGFKCILKKQCLMGNGSHKPYSPLTMLFNVCKTHVFFFWTIFYCLSSVLFSTLTATFNEFTFVYHAPHSPLSGSSSA